MKEDGGEGAALDRLVDLIREETGNALPRARQGYLEEIAVRRARALGQPSLSIYVTSLERGLLDGEWQRLVPLLTVKESFFFRAPQQFEVLQRVLLPRLATDRARAQNLRIWSAAAARGEEAATLALVLAEYEPLAHGDWRVIATDLDGEALEAARRGLYGERAVAQVPPVLLARWFERRGDLYELSPAIRARIDYQPINLARPPYFDLPAEPFDLIFLRNVLIYFRRPLQRRVVGEVADRLAPGGTLFLGASETLWQISDRLAAVDLGDCFAYRHPPQKPPAPPPAPRRPRGEGSPVARVLGRVVVPAPPAAALPPPKEARGARAVIASGAERPPPAKAPDARELVLRAARELAANRLAEAARWLAEARAADGSEPAVYALEGFQADIAGTTEEALTAYRAALFLDPQLYQVRVLLAEGLARLGHPDRAEHQFRETLATLAPGGRPHDLVLLEELPLPNRTGAERRCRVGLGGR